MQSLFRFDTFSAVVSYDPAYLILRLVMLELDVQSLNPYAVTMIDF
jgi:hypothetical protein